MKIEKAYAIRNAHISFVSLVNKAANKRRFLITKADGGKANFTTGGKILKADAETHYVTGIVYEPMVEDTDGNYMTAEEITKAAHWYAKNGDKVDIQHSFEPFKNASVVESWIAKADFEIDGQKVKKGSWLMTMEITDDAVWNDIQKGAITGFSMGGVGEYSTTDDDISGYVEKAGKTDAKNLFARLGEALGLSVVEKGRVTDEFKRAAKSQAFWAAFDSLKSALHYDYCSDYYETDETKIREALQEFNDIIVELLNSPDPITKTIKKPCKKKDDALNGKTECDEPEEKTEEDIEDPEQETEEETAEEEEKEEPEMKVTKAEAEKMFADFIKKAYGTDTNTVTKSEDSNSAGSEELNEDAIKGMVEAAVEKALKPVQNDAPAAEQTVSASDVQGMIDEAVQKAVSSVMKSRNNPSNLNGSGSSAGKSEQHYMHGIL